MPTASDFRSALRIQLKRAEAEGRTYLDIRAGDLHRAVGGYPKPMPRIPICCSVMRQEMMKSCDSVISDKQSDGASFTVRFALPREERSDA
jgi:hypothetical protein